MVGKKRKQLDPNLRLACRSYTKKPLTKGLKPNPAMEEHLETRISSIMYVRTGFVRALSKVTTGYQKTQLLSMWTK